MAGSIVITTIIVMVIIAALCIYMKHKRSKHVMIRYTQVFVVPLCVMLVFFPDRDYKTDSHVHKTAIATAATGMLISY